MTCRTFQSFSPSLSYNRLQTCIQIWHHPIIEYPPQVFSFSMIRFTQMSRYKRKDLSLYFHCNFKSLSLYDLLKFWSSQRANHVLFERKPQHEQNSWKTTVHSILVKATVTCWSFRNLLWVLITISK